MLTIAPRDQWQMVSRAYVWFFPYRYSDMICRYGRPVPFLSMVTNQVVDYIYQAHGHRLTKHI